MSRPESDSPSLLSRLFRPEVLAWRGEQPLGTVFWVHGVAVSSALLLLHAVALARGLHAVEQVLIVVTALYTPWILVAIWRCSANAPPILGTMAKWLTIAWALNSLLVLAALQLELLIRYAGG